MPARCLLPEDLVHEKTGEIRKGQANRMYYSCSNPRCEDPIRADKWDTHVITKTSDAHLQEDPDDVLERSFNFSPEPQWENKDARMQRIVTFMEQRHYLALARQHEEVDLAKQITDANHFHVRLTNMVRDSACPVARSFIFLLRGGRAL